MNESFGEKIGKVRDKLSRVVYNVVNPKEQLQPGWTPKRAREMEVAVSRERVKTLGDLATKDELTGLENRRGFDDYVNAAFSRLNRGQETVISIVLCDADRFKDINDTYGHGVGDVALKQIASALRSGVRLADCVARIGGDEFAVVLPGADETTAFKDMQRIGQKIKETEIHTGKGGFVSVTTSIGIATVHGGTGKTPEEAMRDADTAMYKAKHGNIPVVLSEAVPNASVTNQTEQKSG